jgi:hypothetical protein
MGDLAYNMDANVGGATIYAGAFKPIVRDPSLDLVKGVLVMGMVVYHAMNIFSTVGPDGYVYVRFISSSFILMSGYIVARFHQAQFNADWRGTSRRLIVRGLKLLVLFTLLNLLINLTGIGNPNKVQIGIQFYIRSFFEVYVLGELGRTSFQILLPIAYLLIAAPALLMLGKLSKWFFLGSFATAFASSQFGVESVNLDFAPLAVIGLTGGMLLNAVEKPLAMEGKWKIGGALLTSVLLMKYLNTNQATYALGTMIILKLLYDLSQAVGTGSRTAQASILLGRHSLVSYIAQIIFMQGLSKALSTPRWELGYETILVVFITIVFLLLLSSCLTMLCDRYRFAIKAYKLLFS